MSLLVISTLLILLFFSFDSIHASIHQEVSIVQSPSNQEIAPNTRINISITFTSYSEIALVVLFYCSLSPEFICHYPGLNMTRKISNDQSSAQYFTNFTPGYENGTTMGYHFVIENENSSKQIIPENESYDNYSNIVKASDNQFYFAISLIETQKRSSSNVSFFPFWFIIIELIFLIALYKEQKHYK